MEDENIKKDKKEEAYENNSGGLDDINKDSDVDTYSNPFREGEGQRIDPPSPKATARQSADKKRIDTDILRHSEQSEESRELAPQIKGSFGFAQDDAKDNTPADSAGAQDDSRDKDIEQKENNIKLFMVKQKLICIKSQIDDLLNSINSDEGVMKYEHKLVAMAVPVKKEEMADNAADVIDGIFDGQQMIGKDGKNYDVPVNYASKSKLVEGDVLKLRILNNGKYYYKQTEKAIRINKVGRLACDEDGKQYYVIVGDKKYKVLSASITYFKAQIGDEIIITVPKNRGSEWAAVERF